MKVILVIILFHCFTSHTAELLENGREAVEPEYLDYLLREKKYEEFNRLMEIDVPHLSRSRDENDTTHPRYSPHLTHGDILLTRRQKEEGRQVIDFSKYKSYKWPKGVMPAQVSTEFSSSDRNKIWNFIQNCNGDMSASCTKIMQRTTEKNYVFIFPGDGCYSNLGCIGGQQSLSLGAGCVYKGTVCHEILHALGFTHEQNRLDRDTYIRMRWPDIKKGWEAQFQKNGGDFKDYGTYDCCSLMHYPQRHPDLNDNGKASFDILDPKCNPNCVGNADAMTSMDKRKLSEVYC